MSDIKIAGLDNLLGELSAASVFGSKLQPTKETKKEIEQIENISGEDLPDYLEDIELPETNDSLLASQIALKEVEELTEADILESRDENGIERLERTLNKMFIFMNRLSDKIDKLTEIVKIKNGSNYSYTNVSQQPVAQNGQISTPADLARSKPLNFRPASEARMMPNPYMEMNVNNPAMYANYAQNGYNPYPNANGLSPHAAFDALDRLDPVRSSSSADASSYRIGSAARAPIPDAIFDNVMPGLKNVGKAPVKSAPPPVPSQQNVSKPALMPIKGSPTLPTNSPIARGPLDFDFTPTL